MAHDESLHHIEHQNFTLQNEIFTWSVCLKEDTIIDTKITGR